jgi:hypothetical protein
MAGLALPGWDVRRVGRGGKMRRSLILLTGAARCRARSSGSSYHCVFLNCSRLCAPARTYDPHLIVFLWGLMPPAFIGARLGHRGDGSCYDGSLFACAVGGSGWRRAAGFVLTFGTGCASETHCIHMLFRTTAAVSMGPCWVCRASV